MENLLHFQVGNSKIKYMGTLVLSLPAGHSCPGAKVCKAMADRLTGKLDMSIKDVEYRCYAASMETYAKAYREYCWNNQELLDEAGGREGMAALILDSVAQHQGVKRVRLHGGGDFFSPEYIEAWMDVAEQRPDLLVYGYTKSLTHLASIYRSRTIPDNFRMILSRGGKYDNMINQLMGEFPKNLRVATVVMHPNEADKQGHVIDHDDETAALDTQPEFALLIHGAQPAGSAASAALKRLRAEGVKYGY